MSLSHPSEEHFPEAIEAFCQQCSDDCILCPHQQTLLGLQMASVHEVSQTENLNGASSPPEGVPSSQVEIVQPVTEVKRRPGAPKGNLNALKHGLYIENYSVRNTTPIERAQLMDFNGIITNFKHYMDLTYEQGLKAKTLAEYNETMRCLSIALLALSRSVVVHNDYSVSGLPNNLCKNKDLTGNEIIDYYSKKLAAFPQSWQATSEHQAEP
jgi:hypothetical protein